MALRVSQYTATIGGQTDSPIAQAPGEDRRHQFVFVDEDGGAIDFGSPQALRLTIRNRSNEALVLARNYSGFVGGSDSGVVYFDIFQADLDSIPEGAYDVDIFWRDSTGYETQALEAQLFTIKKRIANNDDELTTPPAIPVILGLNWLAGWSTPTGGYNINDAVNAYDGSLGATAISTFRAVTQGVTSYPVNASGIINDGWRYIGQHGGAGATGPQGATGVQGSDGSRGPGATIFLSGAIEIRYVRPGGDDDNDGLTPGTAWATIERAHEAVVEGNRWEINIEGMTLLDFSPKPIAGVGVLTDVSQFFGRGDLSYISGYTVIDTILGASVSSMSNETYSDMITINTSLTFTANEHRTRLIKFASGYVVPIQSNTASALNILLDDRSKATFPADIVECGATIKSSSAGGIGLTIPASPGLYYFQGIKISHDMASEVAWQSQGGSLWLAAGCYIGGDIGDGVDINAGGTSAPGFGFQSCSVIGDYLPSPIASYNVNTLFLGEAVPFCIGGVLSFAFCALKGATQPIPIGADQGPFRGSFLNCELDGNGLDVINGSHLLAQNIRIDNAPVIALQASDGSYMAIGNVGGTGNAAYAIRLRRNSRCAAIDPYIQIDGTLGQIVVDGNDPVTVGSIASRWINGQESGRNGSSVLNLITVNYSPNGDDIASASSISVTYPIHHVNGTNAISTIDYTPQLYQVSLIADGAWSLVTGGNIGKAISVAAGDTVTLYRDGSNVWWPI